MHYITTDRLNAVGFYNKNLDTINRLLVPLSGFFVKNIIYTELIPEEDKAFFISNKQGVIENFLELGKFSNDFYCSLEQTKNNQLLRTFIWPPNAADSVTTMLRSIGLNNGFTVVQKTSNLIKTWAFADDSDNGKLINLFVNEPNIFYRFIKYFEEQTKEIFSYKKNCFVPFKTPKNNTFECNYDLINKIDLFKKSTAIERHYLFDNTNIYLTNKELQCLYQLAVGLTYKEIGKALSISPKTVRSHIDAIKLKTNINRKHLLIDTVIKQNLFAYIAL